MDVHVSQDARWRCYFLGEDGSVLRSRDSWVDAEEAALNGSAILSSPDDYLLEAPDGSIVAALDADPEASFTVEPEDELDDPS